MSQFGEMFSDLPRKPAVEVKRFVVCPGHVTSRTDHQRHYVGYCQLVTLFQTSRHFAGVPVIDFNSPNYLGHRPGDVKLSPSYMGDYDIFKAIKRQMQQ